jgi:hypothetical protein
MSGGRRSGPQSVLKALTISDHKSVSYSVESISFVGGSRTPRQRMPAIRVYGMKATPARSAERRTPLAVQVPSATMPVSTGIRNSAVCSVVDDAIAPITTGPTT